MAASYFTLGIVHFLQRNYEKALELYAKSLDIMIRVRGQDHMDVAAVYNNMSCVYYKQNKYEEALALYSKSLDIFLKVCLLEGF
jgi:tetratricopeptide (TPR) repeat protein